MKDNLIAATSNKDCNSKLLIFVFVMLYILQGLDKFVLLPTISNIANYFKISSDNGLKIISVNFIGTALGCVFMGEIGEYFNKQKILIYSLLMQLCGCVLAFSALYFELVVFSTFVMGICNAAYIILVPSIILEKFGTISANNNMLKIRGLALPILILTPLIGGQITNLLDWRYLFVLIGLITFITIFLVKAYLKEDKEVINKQFRMLGVFKEYKKLFLNKKYVVNSFFAVFPEVLGSVFLTNLSIVAVSRVLDGVEKVSYVTSIIILTSAIFSFLSIFAVNKKGINFTTKTGLFTVFIAMFSIITYLTLSVSLNVIPIVYWIPIVLLVISTAGVSMTNGFFINATIAAKDKKIHAISLIIIASCFINARALFWSKQFFSGTMISSVKVMSFLLFVAIVIYVVALYKKSNILWIKDDERNKG